MPVRSKEEIRTIQWETANRTKDWRKLGKQIGAKPTLMNQHPPSDFEDFKAKCDDCTWGNSNAGNVGGGVPPVCVGCAFAPTLSTTTKIKYGSSIAQATFQISLQTINPAMFEMGIIPHDAITAWNYHEDRDGAGVTVMADDNKSRHKVKIEVGATHEFECAKQAVSMLSEKNIPSVVIMDRPGENPPRHAVLALHIDEDKILCEDPLQSDGDQMRYVDATSFLQLIILEPQIVKSSNKVLKEMNTIPAIFKRVFEMLNKAENDEVAAPAPAAAPWPAAAESPALELGTIAIGVEPEPPTEAFAHVEVACPNPAVPESYDPSCAQFDYRRQKGLVADHEESLTGLWSKTLGVSGSHVVRVARTSATNLMCTVRSVTAEDFSASSRCSMPSSRTNGSNASDVLY